MSQALSVAVDVAGTEERKTVWRLLQLYLYDFTDFAHADDAFGTVEPDGSFAYPWFEDYWPPTASHQIFLIRVRNDIAGFAMVNDWSPSGEPVDHGLAEFFVMRKYRRTGVGVAAAHSLFRQRPGTWELGVVYYNEPALAFWRAALRNGPAVEVVEREGNGSRWRGKYFRFRSLGPET